MSLCCVPRWLVGHSFADKAGRTVSVTRTVLDQLATSHFIWEPYSRDVIDGLLAYCLTDQHIWRYHGPMICVFIVEPHMPDRVARQFGMLQSIPADPVYSSDHHSMTLKGNIVVHWGIKHQASVAIWNTRLDHIFEADLIIGDATVPEYHDWYLERTVRFISRLGAFHYYLGGLLKTIADRTQEVLPDVFLLATQGFNDIQNHSLYGFEAFPLEERRDKEREWRQDVGRRRKRGAGGGHGGGRSTRRRVGNEPVDQVVSLPEDQLVDPSHDQGNDDHVATNLEDDRDPLVHEDSNIDVPEAPTNVEPAPVVIPDMPSFDLGLTPTPQPNQQHSTTQQPPPLQPTHRPPHKPILSYPTFDLGITPPSDDSNVVAFSQSTESS
ncbi:hypothetical protein POM88_026059 [Heracleum sosnowskyi]|uniref:Aminotransferase-like plant mobile domain-containing protein n=1 Tax=Heracleum sosnowskyi TaxID=360622 RepID=A0AAD8I8C5_9APIA|nr:hypothetical protein POM88_026059 [Heracleum sosnowskyi]